MAKVALFVRNVETTIIAEKKVREEIEKVFSYTVPDADRIRDYKVDYYLERGRMRDAKKWAEWDGKFTLVHKSTIGSGLIEDLYMYLVDRGHEVEIIDKRERPKIEVVFEWKDDIELYDYQLEAVEAFFRNEGRGILQMATASGKTVVAMEIIRRAACPFVVIANRKVLIEQWTRKIMESFKGLRSEKLKNTEARFFYKNGLTVGAIMTPQLLKNVMEGKITTKVARKWMQKRNKTIMDYLDTVGLLIFDEAHHSSSKETKKVLRNINAFYRLGLTATANMREDNTDYEYLAVLGNVVYFFTPHSLVSKGKGSTIYIRMIPLRLPPEKVKYYYSIYREKTYGEMYEEYIVHNDYRNNVLVEKVLEQVLAGRESILLLVDRINHAKILAAKMEGIAEYTYSSDKERKRKMSDFRKKKIKCLVCTYSLIGEGFDFPDLEVLVVGTGKSEIKTRQFIGRLMRKSSKNKKKILYDIVDNVPPFSTHSEKRFEVYCSDDAFVIEEKPSWLHCP